MTNNQLIGAVIMFVGLVMIVAPKIVRNIGGAWSEMLGSKTVEGHPMNALIVFRVLGIPLIVAGALVFFSASESS